MSLLIESVKKQLLSTMKTESREYDSCKDKNEGILHILAPDFFYNQL